MTAGLAVLVGLLAVLASVAQFGLNRIAESERRLFAENLGNVHNLARLRTLLNGERLDLFNMAETPASRWETWRTDLELRRAESRAIMQGLEAGFQHDPPSLAQFHEMRALRDEYAKSSDREVIPLLQQGRKAEAMEIILGSQLGGHLKVTAIARQLEASEAAEAADMARSAQGIANVTVKVDAALGGVGILGAIGLALFLRRAVNSFVQDRLRAESELRRINRARRSISACNQALVRAENEPDLLRQICDIIVQDGGYRMCWIGFAENDQDKSVRPAAIAGFDQDYVANARVSWADTARGRGPTGTAVRTGKCYLCGDLRSDAEFTPWREQALKRGYASALVLPLRGETGVLGALSIYAAETGGFDADEVFMLSELADDLAYGIRAHRNRETRQRVEASLRVESAALEAVANAVVITDLAGRIEWANSAYTGLTGYTLEESVGRNPRDLLKSGRHDREFYHHLWETIMAGEVWQGNMTNRRKDGSLYTEEMTITPLKDDQGNLLHFVAIKQDVTQRLQAEETVRNSERHFRALTDYSLDIVTVMNADATIRYQSSSTERVLGWKPEELVGRSAFELIHPEDAENVRKLLELNLPIPGVVETAIFRYRHKDGSWHVIEAIASNLLQEPAVAGIVVNSRDITDRKRAEEKLQLFRTLIERSQDAIQVVDPATGRFVDVNESACRSLGYTRSELLALTVLDVDQDLDPAALEANQTKLTKAGRLTFETRHRRKDGTTFPVEVSLSLVTLVRKYVVTIARDITERRHAEEALQREQSLFIDLANAIPDHIYIKDPQCRFVRVNTAMLKLFGLGDGAEIAGKTDFDLFSEEHARRAFADEQRILQTGEPMINVEEKETWPDGHISWVSTTKVRLCDPDGCVTGLVGISRDITASKSLEAQFLQAQKMEAFGQLAGGVAHDFNNILASMLMQLELARDVEGISGQSRSWLDEIEVSAQRAARLTRQMLLFSRRQQIETQILNLNDVLDGLCKMLGRIMGEDIAFELKKAEDRLWILADPGMVEQIALNLCVNARDAMPRGGQLVIETRLEDRPEGPGVDRARVGRFACLAVTDTGCGMDKATLQRIFEPFFTTKPVGKGTGLGLATVYGLANQHHGWVEVESSPNQGSTFRVYFPFQEKETVNSISPAASEIRGGTEKILLVEDEEKLRSVMTACLEQAGYQVVPARTGVEAMQIWDDGPADFDLLVTDLVMPGGITGLELAIQLTRAKQQLKVITMTGHYIGAVPESLPRDIVALTKPFTVEALLVCVRKQLDSPGVGPAAGAASIEYLESGDIDE